MSGHTPGRWEAAERGDYDDFDGNSRVIIGDADNTHGHMMRIAVVQHSGDAESEANTRVIEAAPKLLEACRAMLRVLDFISDEALRVGLAGTSEWDRLAGTHDLFGAADAGRAALAEAEDKL